MIMQIAEKVLNIAERESGKRDLWGDTRIDTLELDSLETVALIQAVEQELGITIPDDKASRVETLAELIALAQESQ